MLTDLIPARYRRQVYALLTLAATVFAVYQASDGDWAAFVAGVLTALTGGMARANTPKELP